MPLYLPSHIVWSWQILSAKGITKFFVANIGPVGCAPKIIGKVPWSKGQCLPEVNKVAQDTNVALAAEVAKLRTSLPTSTIVLFDIYKAFIDTASAASKSPAACQ